MRLVHEAHVAAPFGHQRQRGGHAAADGVARDGHAIRVEPVGRAVAHDVLRHGVPLLDGDRETCLGGAVVFDERERGAGAGDQLAHEPIVGAGVAEHPAAAVHVEDHRERAGGTGRAEHAHAHVADVGGDGDPALVDRQLVDRRGLHVIEHLPRLGGRELVEERRLAAAFANAWAARSSTRRLGEGWEPSCQSSGVAATHARLRGSGRPHPGGARPRRRARRPRARSSAARRRARPCSAARRPGCCGPAPPTTNHDGAPSTAPARPTAPAAPPGWRAAASRPSAPPRRRRTSAQNCAWKRSAAIRRSVVPSVRAIGSSASPSVLPGKLRRQVEAALAGLRRERRRRRRAR